MKKRFLIVVDMQSDFVTGCLGNPEAQAIVPAVIQRVKEAKAEGDTVIATLDTHGDNYLDTREGRWLPVPHCIQGTEGWRICAGLVALLDGCEQVEKTSFASVRLPSVIEAEIGNADEVEIEMIGLFTDICLVSNALVLKSAFPEADILVRRSCCAGSTPEKHEAALAVMASCQIDVI
jgi:nicotinamidase-related amidase